MLHILALASNAASSATQTADPPDRASLVVSIIALGVSVLTVPVSALVSFYVAKYQARKNEKQSLENQVNELIRIMLEYPNLESDSFIKRWQQGQGTEDERGRYETFCCFAFNVLHRVWKYHKGDIEKINDTILAREIVHRHRKWWDSDADNTLGYPKDFQAFIRSL